MLFSWITGVDVVWSAGSGTTVDLRSFSVWCGGLLSFSGWCDASLLLLGAQLAAVSVCRSAARHLNFIWASVKKRVQRPKLHFSPPARLIRIASSTFREIRSLAPLFYCLHCNLFLAVRFLAVVFRSLFGYINFSAVGSKEHLSLSNGLWTGEVLSPSLGVLRQARIINNGSRLFFLRFQQQSFSGFHSIFHFSIRLCISWAWSSVLELPICAEFRAFLVVKFGTVIGDQHFRNAPWLK